MSGCAFSISSSSSDAYGMLADRVDEQAALLEADVSGRRADQPRDGVLLHVLAHVVAHELVAEMQRQLLGELGLADAGRAGEEEAAGRTIGLTESGARALDRARDRAAPLLPGRTPRGRATPRASCSRSLSDEDACLAGMRAIRATTSSICVRRADRRATRPPASRPCAARAALAPRAAHLRARLVEHVDGAVGQPVVAQVPRRQLRRRLERVVGVAHAVMRLRSASAAPAGSCTVSWIDGSSIVIFCSRRASARSFSMCLNSSCVVEPTTRSWPVVRIGLISVARSIVPPVVAPAPTVEWISSMKRIGIGRFASAVMTALKRSSKSPRKRVPASSAPVSSEKTSAPFEQLGHVVLQQPRREPFGERGLADAGVADEDRIVLAPPAEDLHRALQLVGAADQRIELAGRGRARSGSSRRRRADRAAVAPPRSPLPGFGVGRRRRLRDPARCDGGTLLMPCVMYSRTSRRVTPCAASSCAAYDFDLLQRRREHVARLHFLAAGALDVQHRRLQHAPERQRLLGLLLLAARNCSTVLVAGTCRDRGAAAAGRRRRRRGSARRPGRAPARRAGARASGACAAATSPRDTPRSGRLRELD